MRDAGIALDCSVVISTHNRAAMLASALEDLIAQRTDGVTFEIIVVDNAATDETREVIGAARARCPHVRYVYEPQRGPASGRNAGIARAHGAFIAFTDDDNRISPTWIAELARAFREHPDIDVIAGRILPNWMTQAPEWLTRDHWVGPLALQDYGDAPFVVDATRPIALSTANLAIRRSALDRIGWFSAQLQRAEDTELLVRFWRAGGRCLYMPQALVAADVQPERMTKEYHARWHNANGGWTAAFDLAEIIHRDGSLRPVAADTVRLWGIPAFIVREMLIVGARWLAASATRSRRALVYEHRVRFLAGYIGYRFHHHRATHRLRSADVLRFAQALVAKKVRKLTARETMSPPAAGADDTTSSTPSRSDPKRSSASYHSPASGATEPSERDTSATRAGAPPTAQWDGIR
jgi:glycosyltransferase involved in cell wall biosynthesis